jgi:hypothetical protein
MESPDDGIIEGLYFEQQSGDLPEMDQIQPHSIFSQDTVYMDSSGTEESSFTDESVRSDYEYLPDVEYELRDGFQILLEHSRIPESSYNWINPFNPEEIIHGSITIGNYLVSLAELRLRFNSTMGDVMLHAQVC